MKPLTETPGDRKVPATSPRRPGARARVARIARVASLHWVVTVVATAAVVRVTVAVASFLGNPANVVPDEAQYVGLASSVAKGAGAEAWYPGYGQALYDSTRAFSATLALLFRILTPSRLVGQLLAATFGVATAVAVAVLARRVLSRRWALVAGLLCALWPSQVIWSSLVLRESMIWFGLVALAIAVVHLTSTSAVRFGVALACCAAALTWLGYLRSQTMVVAAWALLLAAVLVPGARRLPRAVGATAVAVVVPLALGLGPLGWQLVSSSSSTLARTRATLGVGAESATTDVGAVGDGRAVGCPQPTGKRKIDVLPGTPTTRPGASAIAGAPTRTMVDSDGHEVQVVCGADGRAYAVGGGGLGTDVAYLPKGLAATLLRPFPWELHEGSGATSAAVEELAWYPLYVFAAVGLVAGWRRLDVLAFPVLVGGGLLVTGALTQGNLGTAFRHRGQLLWVVALLAVVGLEHLVGRRGRRGAVA